MIVSVHNEGPPIPAAERERIFERFYRSPATRHGAPGTGLGLSIVKKTANAHRGRTWVVSEDGKGTTFSLALPRAQKARYEPVPDSVKDKFPASGEDSSSGRALSAILREA
jgi:two-component system sensor histidine kinase KdpD